VLEILEQGGERHVELGAVLFEAFVDVVVHVPAAFGDLDVANAFFDETAGEQAALAELVFAVFFTSERRVHHRG
jgi:hypothetical protein